MSEFCKDGWWLENFDVDTCLMEIHVKLRKSVQQLMNPKKSLTNHNKSFPIIFTFVSPFSLNGSSSC